MSMEAVLKRGTRMTIEDKLKELGYEPSKSFPREYTKKYSPYIVQVICLSVIEHELDEAYIDTNDIISSQQRIDNIQIAFNRLQEDLKKLQEFGLNVEEVKE